MAVQVKIPTILRSYTGGAKSVPGDGRHPVRAVRRPGEPACRAQGSADHRGRSLHRFVNVYVNDEDVRFTGSLDTALSDGDAVTILPAVAGG